MITAEKEKKRTGYKLGLAILTAVVCLMFVPANVKAEGIDFNAKIMELKTKFPQGMYWNHVGSAVDNPDGYTTQPCTLHNDPNVSHTYGTNGCTCNHFVCSGHLMAAQCMGYANKLGYDVFGDTTWTVYNNPNSVQIAGIQVGDIVRLNGSHSVFVIARTGNDIMVGEANYPNGCQINWGRIINLAQVTVSSYEHANNYTAIIGSGVVQPDASTEATTGEATTEQATTEVPTSFTGWKQTSDRQHYQYFKEGKLLKKQWLTLKKKKYYLDKKGYRVTGLYKIGKKTYYFNKNGVLQKQMWVTEGNETYYVDSSGVVLKKQWLYYKNTLVYVTGDGSMAKNELVKINGKTYYFNVKGKRSKGFKKVNGKYYYCNSSGIIQKKQWVKKGGKTYYVQKSGVRAQSKLIKIGQYHYYFNEKGQLVKKKYFTYKGQNYWADKDGRCKVAKDESEDESEDVPDDEPKDKDIKY